MFIYEDTTKKRIFIRSIEHLQGSVKGSWGSCGTTEHLRECHNCVIRLHLNTLLLEHKNERKVRKSSELDMLIFKYEHEKELNRDNGGNFV